MGESTSITSRRHGCIYEVRDRRVKWWAKNRTSIDQFYRVGEICHWTVRTILVVALALCAGSVINQPVSADDAFIPALDEPCGAACPEPDAPMSRLNYPQRDDNFQQMFVPTETGLALVFNPHWNGTTVLEGEWCGMLCQDPYSEPSTKNPNRSNDASPIQILTNEEGGDVILSFAWNPHWVIPEHRLATIEGIAVASEIDAIIAEASVLLPPLGSLGDEANPDAEEPDGKVLRRTADRTNIAYYASGDDVFLANLLQSIGGVQSQGSVWDDQHDGAPKVQFVLKPNGDYPGYVLVSNSVATARYPIAYDELVPMSLFVDSGGTSLYTLWEEDKLSANFRQGWIHKIQQQQNEAKQHRVRGVFRLNVVRFARNSVPLDIVILKFSIGFTRCCIALVL